MRVWQLTHVFARGVALLYYFPDPVAKQEIQVSGNAVNCPKTGILRWHNRLQVGERIAATC
jgi:hypothetical protein